MNDKLPPIGPQNQNQKQQLENFNHSQSVIEEDQQNQSSKPPSQNNSRIKRSVSHQGSIQQKQTVSAFQAKKQRTQIESEAQQLLARIQKLQTEEIVMEKKIDETTKKAYDVYAGKRRNQKKKVEVQQRKLTEVDQIPFTHPKAQLDQLRVQLAKEDLIKSRKQGVDYVKQIQAQNKERREREEVVRLESIKWKIDIIQQSKKNSYLKQEISNELKIARVRQDIQQKQEDEIQKAEKEKEKLKFLESLEMDLLDRIKNTALRHQIAQEQLDFSKKKEPKEFEQRFGIERNQDSYNSSQQQSEQQSQQQSKMSNSNSNNLQYGLYINNRGQLKSGQRLDTDRR